MPQLEPLHLKMTGSADGLSAAFREAQSMTAGLAGRIAGLAKGPALAIAALATTAVSAGAAISKISEAMEQVDAANDAANRLGVTLKELAQLRGSLGRVTGADDGTIDGAIVKLQVNLGKAAREGAGEVFEALQRIGLDAGDLLAAGPQRAVELIAERVARLNTTAEQTDAIFQILGKSGLQIAAAFRESPDELRKVSEEIGNSIRLTDQQAQQIGLANDAWEDMTRKIQDIINQVAAEVSPLLQVVYEDVLGVATEFGDWKDGVKLAVDVVAQLYGVLTDVFEIVEVIALTASGQLAKAFEKVGEALSLEGASEALERINAIRGEAANRSRPKNATEAEIETVELSAQAVNATREAAKTVQQKADRIRDSIRAEPVGPLSAAFDRVSQIRKIDEIQGRNAAQLAEKQLMEQKQTNTKLDRLILSMKPLPALNLD